MRRNSLMSCGGKIGAVAAVFLLVFPAFAYQFPLSSEQIREAFFLGQARDARTTAFLDKYEHHTTVPSSGPHIDEIRLLTPFAQIVERASESVNYTSQDADQEFSHSPGTLRLFVRIYFTPSYSDLVVHDGKPSARGEDFWRDFNVQLIQAQAVDSRHEAGRPLYAPLQDGSDGALDGAEIELDYDAKRVAAAPAKIVITGPVAIPVETTFDLSTLR